MEAMGLEPLDRLTALALRSLQDLIMLKKKKVVLTVVPTLVYAGEFGAPLALGLLAWLLTMAGKLIGQSPAHLAAPIPHGLASLAMGRQERRQRLHSFLLASRALLFANRKQLTGADLAAAELLAEDIADIACEFC